MSYFDISIDNDITYLLNEVGYNVKINNVEAKALISNTRQERNFDDKRITSYSELKRGDYIEYSDLYFLILNEINDKRHNTYYKSVMRNCNYDIKFIVDGKLYLFYSIMESDKFLVSNNDMFSVSGDSITVTLPETEITKQLKKQDSFIKFNQKWEIEGVDYTRKGLVILSCKAEAISDVFDDLENEIANRYRPDATDILNGNIEPITPFEIVEDGEIPVDPEPEEPEPTEPVEDDYSIEIVGADRFGLMTTTTFTAKVLNNNVEVADKEVIFSVSNTLAIIKNQENNTCRLETNKQFKTGTFILKVTLLDDETIFTEKEIIITGL